MRYRRLHSWNVSPKEAIRIQNRLKKRLILRKFSGKLRNVAGVDASFLRNGKAGCAIIILSYPKLQTVEIVRVESRTHFPYIPTLLTFREGPAILSAFGKLKTRPDAVLFDGQGIAHPRLMGEAAHLGILLNIPAIGCAKNPLYGTYSRPNRAKGSFTYLMDNKSGLIGAVLRTRSGVKPIFVSCGYKIDLKTALKIVLAVSPKYRIPEPLRRAHSLAKF